LDEKSSQQSGTSKLLFFYLFLDSALVLQTAVNLAIDYTKFHFEQGKKSRVTGSILVRLSSPRFAVPSSVVSQNLLECTAKCRMISHWNATSGLKERTWKPCARRSQIPCASKQVLLEFIPEIISRIEFVLLSL
jgi:hypothetical protein